MAVPHKPTSEWTLCVVAVSCALHAAEEYFVLVIVALLLARVGWRRPALSLVIPAATLVNAILFHILPTVVQGRIAPGVYTATLHFRCEVARQPPWTFVTALA